MPQLVNWDLIKQPVNWIIVALMLAIATFALCVLMGDGADLQHASGSAGQ